MKLVKPLMISFAVLMFSCTLNAQKNDDKTGGDKKKDPIIKSVDRNFIKTNITSIPLKNFSLQYERVISKSVSLALGFRTMPVTTVPLKDIILKAIGDDPETRDILNSATLSNYAVTPEIRFYLSKKGYGRGFYIAPYYRYAKFTTNNVKINYTDDFMSAQSVNISGDLSAHNGGLMFGAQWALGKSICLDWWILGAHFGNGTGTFSGLSSRTLSSNDQAEIKQILNDIDIPFVEKTVSVTSNTIKVVMDGPFGGLRAGISLGFRF